MPVNYGQHGMVFSIRFRSVGAGKVARDLDRVAQAAERLQRATGGVRTVSTAQATLSKETKGLAVANREAVKSQRQFNATLYDSSRIAFRYSYYALMALQLGQALIARKILQAPIRIAADAELWAAKLKALGPEVKEQFGAIEKAAEHIAMTLPYTFTEAMEAMEKLYRVGRPAEKLGEEAQAVAQLALISGRSLEAEAGLVGTVLNVFAEDGIKALDVVDQLAKAMTLSRFSIGDFDAALSNAMATAAAFNQTFESTLTMITALGRAGVEAGRAGTMVRRLLVRIGEPDVMQFYEQMTELYPRVIQRWNEMVQQGQVQGPQIPLPEVLPTLYNPETGDITQDMGRVIVATAQAMDLWIKAADSAIERANRWRLAQQELYRLFGIRQIEPFLAMANITYQAGNKIYTGLQAYDKMQEEIRKATEGLGFSAEYVQEVMGTWAMAQRQWESSSQIFQQLFGTVMMRAAEPFIRLKTEFVNFLTKLAQSSPVLTKVAGGLTLVAGAGGMLAGALGVVGGIVALLRGRLADLGVRAIETGEAMRRLGKTTAELQAMGGFRVGFRYLLSYAIGPLRILRSLLVLVGMAFAAWQLNLGGIRDKLGPILSRFNEKLRNTGQLAQEAKKKLTRLVRTEAGPTQLGLNLQAVGEGIRLALGGVVSGLISAITLLVRIVRWGWNNIGLRLVRFVGGMFRIVAFVFGGGDVQRGFRNIGTMLGILIAIKAILAAIHLTMVAGRGLRRVAGWLLRPLVGLFGRGGLGGAGGTTSTWTMVSTGQMGATRLIGRTLRFGVNLVTHPLRTLHRSLVGFMARVMIPLIARGQRFYEVLGRMALRVEWAFLRVANAAFEAGKALLTHLIRPLLRLGARLFMRYFRLFMPETWGRVGRGIGGLFARYFRLFLPGTVSGAVRRWLAGKLFPGATLFRDRIPLGQRLKLMLWRLLFGRGASRGFVSRALRTTGRHILAAGRRLVSVLVQLAVGIGRVGLRFLLPKMRRLVSFLWGLLRQRLPRLRLPPIPVPRIRLPRIRLPRFRWPRIRAPQWPRFRWPSIPRLRWPHIRIPRLRLPHIPIPRLRLPRISFEAPVRALRQFATLLIRAGRGAAGGLARATRTVGIFARAIGQVAIRAIPVLLSRMREFWQLLAGLSIRARAAFIQLAQAALAAARGLWAHLLRPAGQYLGGILGRVFARLVPRGPLPRFRWPRLPRFRWPRIRMPRLRFPSIRIPRFRWPRIHIPRWELPRFRWPRLPRFRWPRVDRVLGRGARAIGQALFSVSRKVLRGGAQLTLALAQIGMELGRTGARLVVRGLRRVLGLLGGMVSRRTRMTGEIFAGQAIRRLADWFTRGRGWQVLSTIPSKLTLVWSGLQMAWNWMTGLFMAIMGAVLGFFQQTLWPWLTGTLWPWLTGTLLPALLGGASSLVKGTGRAIKTAWDVARQFLPGAAWLAKAGGIAAPITLTAGVGTLLGFKIADIVGDRIRRERALEDARLLEQLQAGQVTIPDVPAILATEEAIRSGQAFRELARLEAQRERAQAPTQQHLEFKFENVFQMPEGTKEEQLRWLADQFKIEIERSFTERDIQRLLELYSGVR